MAKNGQGTTEAALSKRVPIQNEDTLHKTNIGLKINGWKMRFPFWKAYFRVRTVSSLDGIHHNTMRLFDFSGTCNMMEQVQYQTDKNHPTAV